MRHCNRAQEFAPTAKAISCCLSSAWKGRLSAVAGDVFDNPGVPGKHQMITDTASTAKGIAQRARLRAALFVTCVNVKVVFRVHFHFHANNNLRTQERA
jgi:hypothetical protein